MSSDCGTVGTAVASFTGKPGFESSQRLFKINKANVKMTVLKKMLEMAHFRNSSRRNNLTSKFKIKSNDREWKDLEFEKIGLDEVLIMVD